MNWIQRSFLGFFLVSTGLSGCRPKAGADATVLAMPEKTVLSRDDIKSVRMLGHANVPIKVLVHYSRAENMFGFTNSEYARNLLRIIGDINRSDGLRGREVIKLAAVGSREQIPEYNEDFQKLFDERPDTKSYAEYVYADGVDHDQWLQDFGEILAINSNDDAEYRLAVMNLNMPRGLSALAPVLKKKWNTYFFEMEKSEDAKSAGGNIEVTPNDILYIGNTASEQIRKFFIDKGYGRAGDLVELDASWLRVGHVDEFISTVATEGPCGMAIVRASPALGLKVMEETTLDEIIRTETATPHPYLTHPDAMEPGEDPMPLIVFRQSWLYQQYFAKGDIKPIQRYGTAADNKEKPGWFPFDMDSSEADLQSTKRGRAQSEKTFRKDQAYVEKIIAAETEKLRLAIVQKTSACRDVKVVEVPVVYHCLPFQGPNDESGFCSSLLPNVSNFLSLRNHVVVPDPFFPKYRRETERAFASLNQKVHFIDVMGYHVRKGDVHCSTNVMRLPNDRLYK